MKHNLPLLLSLLVLSGCQHLKLPGRNSQSEVPAETILRMADKAYAQGDLLNTEQLLKETIAQNPEDPEGYFKLAQVLRIKKDWQGALNTLDAASKLAPENANLLSEMARIYLNQDQPEMAIRVLDRALLQDKTFISAYLLKGVALDMVGQHRQAQAVYQQGLALNPAHADILNNLGLSYTLSGDLKDALEILEPLVQHAPQARYRQNLAIAYGLAGWEDKARATVGADLKPEAVDNNLAYFRRIRALYQERALKAAQKEDWQSLLSVQPTKVPQAPQLMALATPPVEAITPPEPKPELTPPPAAARSCGSSTASMTAAGRPLEGANAALAAAAPPGTAAALYGTVMPQGGTIALSAAPADASGTAVSEMPPLPGAVQTTSADATEAAVEPTVDAAAPMELAPSAGVPAADASATPEPATEWYGLEPAEE